MKRVATVVLVTLALAACAAPSNIPSGPPPGEPAGYAGIDSGALRIAMGTPAFVRKETGGSELWRYDGPGCKAFFFLYPQNGALSVRHVETVPRPQDASADPDCLSRLRVKPATS
ncbi:MAG TPA: hypothetical protein VG867_04725 [Rhizomicrobium sp.]|nr:hypothetical protein [Rhizomicrobium sp.]